MKRQAKFAAAVRLQDQKCRMYMSFGSLSPRLEVADQFYRQDAKPRLAYAVQQCNFTLLLILLIHTLLAPHARLSHVTHVIITCLAASAEVNMLLM